MNSVPHNKDQNFPDIDEKNASTLFRKIESEKKMGISNWKQRLKAALVMASFFVFILHQGTLALAATIILVQLMCYKEILTIGFTINKNPRLPKFRMTVWYFFFVWNYTLIGETFGALLKTVPNKSPYVSVLFNHNRFIGFCLYSAGIVLFVLNLAGKYDIKRFRLLAIVHVLLVVITLPTYLLIKCSLEGMVWAVVPLCSVLLNDTFAYLFGKMIGKRPLIDLSPNKTWEGFIGGIFGTIISTLALSYLLCNFKHFVCPVEYNSITGIFEINANCTPSFNFRPTEYYLVPSWSISMIPFLIDSLCIAIFASFIAPFAGFFASGFKRAFNIKDFGDSIPGHGGILDRFDCQFLMALFMYVYMSTFLKTTKLKKIYGKVLSMNDGDQIVFYNLLKNFLEENRIL